MSDLGDGINLIGTTAVTQSVYIGSDLSVYSFRGSRVRVVLVDGEPAFVLSDLAKVLGYRDASDAGRILRDRHKGYAGVRTPGGTQMMIVVSEAGMNRLVMRSNASEAEDVQDWLAEDVMPAIRKTGGYTAPQTPVLPKTYAEALRELLATVERADALEAQSAIDAPKVEAYDALMDADGYYSMESAAKMCGVGRTTLYKRLREAGVIQPGSTLPYQKHMHHFVLTAGSWTDREGNVHPSQTTRVRPSGLPFLMRKAAE